MSVSIELKNRARSEEDPENIPNAEGGNVKNGAVKRTADEVDDDEDPEEIARVEKYQSRPFFRRFFLESIFTLYTLAAALYGVPLNTLMHDKCCTYVFGYNASVCEELHEAEDDVKNPVLAYTNTYSTVRDIVLNVPAGLAAVIVGNYLTRYGFRTPLLVVLAGGIITCVCQLLTALVMPAPLIFNALADIPGSIAGGPIVITTAAYTNIALRVPRSLHLGRITTTSLCAGVGTLIAVFSGATLAEAFGIEILLGLCILLQTTSFVLVVLFLEDIDVPKENKKDTWRESLWLSLKNGLITSIRAVSQKRPLRGRAQIICVIICCAVGSIGMTATTGSFAIAYTRNVMSYDPSQFTLYSGVSMLLAFAFIFPMITISKKLKWSQPVMIAVGSAFFVLKLAMLSLTEFFPILFYIQMVVGVPFVLSPLSMRAYMTSLVENSEVSVVMALVSLIEKFVPLVGGLLGSYIYTLTSVSFPGCFYLILSFINLIPVGAGLYCRMILSWNKKDKKEFTHL